MNNFIKFFLLQVLFFFLVILINLYLNYKYDLYGVFNNRKKVLAYYDAFNLRVYKTNELLNSQSQYNSFLIGGSRFLAFDEKLFESYTGNKFYNFCGIRSDMYDNYIQIQFLIKNFTVKNIVLQIGIDDIFYFKDNSENIQRKSHYLASGENKFKYYFNFLFSFDLINLIKFTTAENYILKTDKKNSNSFYLYIINEGRIASNEDEYYKSEFNLRRKKNILLHPKARIEENLEYLKKIIEITEANNINLIIFTAPNYIEYLESLNQNDVKLYLEKLSYITSFWNFTTINSITTDNHNFYEYIHYRKHIADMIVSKIYNDDSKIPGDFGVLVKKSK